MRRWLRVLVVLVPLAGIGLGGWCYLHRKQLARQWAVYRVGAAEPFRKAQSQIIRCETGPDREALIHELVRKWGTGNQRFDLHLARHLGQAPCTDALREAFSSELGRREELLPRWAHYWTWRAKMDPDQQIASILAYLDTLVRVEPVKPITWREVLDLQAVFQLTGQTELARRLSPANWRDRYRRWQQSRPVELPHVPRPARPFAD